LTSNDAADHSIVPGPAMHFIWAHGQEGAHTNVSDYPPNVLKYHGNKNRAFLSVDFFANESAAAPASQNNVSSSVSSPGACSPAAGSYSSSGSDYSLTWTGTGPDVTFQLNARIALGQWTAVGFSPVGAMSDAEMIIIILTTNGTVDITDRHSSGHVEPQIDTVQSVNVFSYSYTGGKLSITFKRPFLAQTSDQKSLTQCQYYLYPVVPGAVGPDGHIEMHTVTPVVSTNQICLSSCNSASTATVDKDAPAAAVTASPAATTKATPLAASKNAAGHKLVCNLFCALITAIIAHIFQ